MSEGRGKENSDLFSIVGEDFFKPLVSLYKSIYLQCLRIIYDSYRTELSYGIERELLIRKLTWYFDELTVSEIQFEDDEESISDSRTKASTFLRKLKEYGWVEYETGDDQRTRVTMPNYAVSVIRNLEAIAQKKETEYQSEISAIYSLLTNADLMQEPYAQVIKPVYDRTVELFTGLKQLNTSIKKYIDELTGDKPAEEILANYFTYAAEIGSKAYHRLYTCDNVSRFRNVILVKLDDIRSSGEVFERTAWGYQKVEGEADLETAREHTRKLINDIIDHFGSYDEIVREIEKKHTRYLSSTVRRARFLLMNTNNTEGKISTILRLMADECAKDEAAHLDADASDEICMLFNIFTQGFISSESIRAVPAARKMADVGELFTPAQLSEAEREAIRIAAYEKNKNRFSRKNVSSFVAGLLEGRDAVRASELAAETKRDMIRLIFISLYGQSARAVYTVIPKEDEICRNGFRFHDFEIRRKTK